MSRYIAITFGPITRVISMAKTTRGIWAASYLFSYLAKQVIEPFRHRTFLLPAIEDDMFTAGKYDGAGIFPDRYIFKAEDGDFDTLVARVDIVLDGLAEKVAPRSEDIAWVRAQLKDTFKIYFFEQPFDTQNEREIVESCENSLNLIENQDTFVPVVYDGQNMLDYIFNGKSERRDLLGFLKKDAGIEEGFKSIVEISSGNKEPERRSDRYVAIVYADGDSMGKAFASGKVKTADLSEALLDFNHKATGLINDFSGQPVYIGGDDLFFFAPVYRREDDTSVFSLIDKLDQAFKQTLADKGIVGPTLSFGLSITYYKYPMAEAVDITKHLLFSLAKGYQPPAKSPFGKEHYEAKNNIAFSVQKHSGQTRSALLHKGFTESYRLFNEIANAHIQHAKSPDEADSAFLHSLMHNLRQHEAILLHAVEDKDLLDNYFANFYNEAGHDAHAAFFGQVKALLLAARKEYKTSAAAIELTYLLLQFIHMVNFDTKK